MSTPEELSKRREHLSQTKRALLQKWKRGELSVEANTQTIPRRMARGPIPLSFSQQRLWFIDQLIPGNPVYNLTSAIRFTGELNVAAFEKSLNEIVRRHEILRTTFPTRDGKAMQAIAPPMRLSLPVTDLSEIAEDEREAIALQLAISAAQQPFDLSQGPLILARLVRLSEQRHIFLFIMHHIISDGWSQSVLLRELKALYEAYVDGKPSPLPELPIHYADFAVWQREWLQGEMLTSQLAYWKQHLEGAAYVLQLPIDRPRPPVQTFRGRTRVFELTPVLSKALKELSQREGCTLYMTLQAAFKTLLYRYSGQEDIIVGAPVANRQRVETEGLIGFFANTLALRTLLTEPCSFLDLLGRVRETLLGAYSHQDLPFEYLVEELHLERDMSRNPLFQVMLNFGNTPTSDLNLPGLHAEFSAISGGTAMFDLWLSMWDWQEQLRGSLEFNADIFEPTTIDRLLQHFQTLLEGIVADPTQSLSTLPLLTTAEQQQILVEWNTTHVPYALERCLHEHIEARIEQSPDAIAVLFEGQYLTYAELNRQANQLAHHLRALGIGADMLVGICMERSLELIIGLLAILKAGGAYVPLDPDYPQERLAFLLEDTNITAVLTQHHLAGRLPEQGVEILCLDTDQEKWSREDTANPRCHLHPENLAYVIYTSGSTGKPKGVMTSHRSICNRLLWMQETYDLTPTDHVLQKTPFSFDVSVWEFFWPLIAGATLIIARPEGHRDSTYLAELIGQEQITTLHFVPSLLHVFLEESALEHCDSLKRVICSGEALSSESIQRFFAQIDAQLYNLYGPTEAAVDVTSWACQQQQSNDLAVPIGRPIANTQIYLLDKQLSPVPIGVSGELHIGGIAPARGYLKRQDLTAEKFIPDPFSSVSGARMYKTGDLARYLPDGNIEFQGRIDHQVKLRGYRIELGEIESALRQHTDVQDTVVMLREDMPDTKQLVAYVVLHEDILQHAETGNKAESLQYWQKIFDEIYDQASIQEEPLLNLAGWNCSYTGMPIPVTEMREWVERTIDRLLGLHPVHVLEIGCGTGLLLLRLAPYCTTYIGTDFSGAGLESIQRQILNQGAEYPQVQLLQRVADDFTNLETTYDLVILNSVIQYFPTVEYLLSVLSNAFQVTKPGGAVFLGDVRHLALLETFHTSVELHWAQETMTVEQLRERIRLRKRQEAELVIDPGFFRILKQHFPQISHIEILLKRGLSSNEMIHYRYDVLLYKEAEEPLNHQPASLRLDWQEQQLDQARIRQILQERKPELLLITHIPNTRLSADIQARNLLQQEDGKPQTVADLRQALQQSTVRAGIDPEHLWESCNDLPYVVSLHWSGGETDGSFEAIYRHQDLTGTTITDPLSTAVDLTPPVEWQVYANSPLQSQIVSQYTSILREYLKERLPEYMVPSVILLLDNLPLSASGKVDRRALPAIDNTRSTLQTTFLAPRTPLEAALAEIWKQVLGLERIGIHDNFFELGGDSIRSIQIVSRASTAGIRLTPRLLFQHQTIAELAMVTEVVQPTIVQAGDAYLSSHSPVQQRLPQNEPLVHIDLDKLSHLLGDNVQIEDVYPLTPMQRSMIFHRLHTGNAELYWICWTNSIKRSSINIPAFEQAWQRVIDQYTMARSVFVWEGLDEPLQVVLKQAQMKIEVYDWRSIPFHQQERQADEYIYMLRSRGNPITQAPYLHLAFAQLTDEDYYMFRGFNYMLQDGWSSTLLIRDFSAFYEAFCRKQELQLEPPRPYRDYMVWLQQQDRTQTETFWKNNLKGFTASAPLADQYPPGYPQAGDPYFKERLTLSVATTTALQSLARKHQFTLATLLTGAWALIVSHYSQSDDITFGYLCSGRPSTLAGSEYMVGFFNNLLPLRVSIPRDMQLLTWLKALQTQVVELREYEQTSITQIKAWLGVPEPARLFESYLVFENFPRYTYEAVGGKARMDFGIQHSNYRQTFVPTEHPLRVEFWPFQQLVIMMSGYLRYFQPETVDRLLQQMKTALEGMSTSSTLRVGELMHLLE